MKVKNNNSDFFGKIKKVKGKLFDYIVNPSASIHNNIENRNGKDLDFVKRQKKTGPVFSIDDDQELGTFLFEFRYSLNCTLD